MDNNLLIVGDNEAVMKHFLPQRISPSEYVDLNEICRHNDAAKKLMKAVLGDDCSFDTPKPLKLTERLIQMFCPKDGIVLDAFGGSATTAHAVLSLNASDPESNRQFIIIEKDFQVASYAKERIERVISGNWVDPRKDTKPLGGSFDTIYYGMHIS